MRDGLLAQPVDALHTHDVVASLLENMRSDGESVPGERQYVAIGLRPGGGAVAEGPGLLSIGGAKCPDFEGYRDSWSNARSRRVCRLNGRRCLLRTLRIEHVDRLEIVVRAAPVVGDLEDLAVRAGLGVDALDSLSRRVPAVRERPFEPCDARITI